jgi:hypothetical protein
MLRVEIRNDEPELLLRMKDPRPTDPAGRGAPSTIA